MWSTSFSYLNLRLIVCQDLTGCQRTQTRHVTTALSQGCTMKLKLFKPTFLKQFVSVNTQFFVSFIYYLFGGNRPSALSGTSAQQFSGVTGTPVVSLGTLGFPWMGTFH